MFEHLFPCLGLDTLESEHEIIILLSRSERTTLNTSSNLRVSVKYSPNRIAFDTTLRACGKHVSFLMPLLFLAHCTRLGLVLGQHDVSNAVIMFLPQSWRG